MILIVSLMILVFGHDHYDDEEGEEEEDDEDDEEHALWST